MSNIQIYKGSLSNAIQDLSAHVNDKSIFNLEQSQNCIGVTIDANLTKKILRQSSYDNCVFRQTNLTSVGMSGSKFVETKFFDCVYDNANLHSCEFINVLFTSEKCFSAKVLNGGFHKSTIINSCFENLHIQSCGFTDVIFYDVTFKNCTIKLCSLENAKFINCTFINVNMSTLNLEYSEFNNVKFKECILPFHSIFSAFGLIKQLKNSENTFIYSTSNSNKKIYISDYMNLIPQFEKYYIYKKKYLQLCNISLYKNDKDRIINFVLEGLLYYIQERDFRNLKHLCNYISTNNIFTIKQRRVFYDKIVNWIATENFTIAEYHSYQLTCGELRDYLINDNTINPIVNFYIKTNIEPYDIEKQVILLSTFEKIFDYCQIDNKSVELRHNSAFVDFINVFCNNMNDVSKILIMMYSSLSGITLFLSGIKKLVTSIQDIKLKNDDHNQNIIQQEKDKLEMEKIKIELDFLEKMKQVEYDKELLSYKKMELEYNDMARKSKEYNQILSDNGIILSVSHTTKNISNPPFQEILHYNELNNN